MSTHLHVIVCPQTLWRDGEYERLFKLLLSRGRLEKGQPPVTLTTRDGLTILLGVHGQERRLQGESADIVTYDLSAFSRGVSRTRWLEAIRAIGGHTELRLDP